MGKILSPRLFFFFFIPAMSVRGKLGRLKRSNKVAILLITGLPYTGHHKHDTDLEGVTCEDSVTGQEQGSKQEGSL